MHRLSGRLVDRRELIWFRIWLSKPIRAISGDHTRHERSYAAAARLVTGFRQDRRRQIRWRFALVRWRRSDVQDGARFVTVRSRTVFAVDDLAAGESAKRPHLAAHGPRHGRSLLRVLPQGSQTDHARHRRHIRRGSWRPAIAAVQRALRRIWLSADRRI